MMVDGKMRLKMKVSDFDVDFSGDSNLFTCCMSHVMMCHDQCKVGEIIECDECGCKMTLTSVSSKLMWVGMRKQHVR